jgi:hypothetical protein
MIHRPRCRTSRQGPRRRCSRPVHRIGTDSPIVNVGLVVVAAIAFGPSAFGRERVRDGLTRPDPRSTSGWPCRGPRTHTLRASGLSPPVRSGVGAGSCPGSRWRSPRRSCGAGSPSTGADQRPNRASSTCAPWWFPRQRRLAWRGHSASPRRVQSPCPVYRWRSRRFSLAACRQPVGDLAEVGNDVVGRVLGGDLDRDPHPPGATVAMLGRQAASPTRPRRA